MDFNFAGAKMKRQLTYLIISVLALAAWAAAD